MTHSIKVHLALFTVTLIYSINYVVAKILMPDYIGPFGVIVIRVWASALLFTIIHAFLVKESVKERFDYVKFAYCAFFGIVVNQLAFFKGLSITSPINAAIIMTTVPILVLLMSIILYQEIITWSRFAGVLVGGIGAFLLISSEQPNINIGNNLSGDLLIVLNAFAYATYLVLNKPLLERYDPLTVVKWVFIFGSIGVLPFGLQEVLLAEWVYMPWFAYLILGFIIIFVTVVNYLLNTWGMKFVSPTVVGFYIYMQPVLTSIIAVASDKDQLTTAKIFFSLLIFAGVYLVSRD